MELSKDTEFRKVQSIAHDRSLGITIPKRYAKTLGIGKGDFVRIVSESNRIIIERVGQ